MLSSTLGARLLPHTSPTLSTSIPAAGCSHPMSTPCSSAPPPYTSHTSLPPSTPHTVSTPCSSLPPPYLPPLPIPAAGGAAGRAALAATREWGAGRGAVQRDLQGGGEEVIGWGAGNAGGHWCSGMCACVRGGRGRGGGFKAARNPHPSGTLSSPCARVTRCVMPTMEVSAREMPIG